MQNEVDTISKKVHVAETKINKDLNLSCRNIDYCFNKLNSTPLKDENVIKIHSLAVNVIDEIFEGARKLLSGFYFATMMRRSHFFEFRSRMGNFSNVVGNKPVINTLELYDKSHDADDPGTISYKCSCVFKQYIPEFSDYPEKLSNFLKTTSYKVKKWVRIEINELKEKNKLKIEQLKNENQILIEKLGNIKEKKLTISDDTFDYLKGTRLAIKDSKDDMCDLINKVKKFNIENPMSPTELKRAYIRNSDPINSAVRDSIANQINQGISFIRNLSAGIQLSSLIKRQIETLENKTVYRYITIEELLDRYLDSGYESLSKIDDKERESEKFKKLEKENSTKAKFYESLSEAYYESEDDEEFIGFLNKNKPKIKFRADPGFTTTTLLRGHNHFEGCGDIELEIMLPRGPKVLDLVEENVNQSEILLKKYTKFVIQKVKPSTNWCIATIEVTIA